MYKVTLENGAIIENLSLNGNNFISSEGIEASTFDGGMSLVKLEVSSDSADEGDVKAGYYKNSKLYHLTAYGSETWFAFDTSNFVSFDDYVPPSLEEVKTSKLEEINTAYTESVSIAKIGVPEDEIQTWDIQKLEAQAWESANKATDFSTPFISGLLVTRNIEREARGLLPLTIDELRQKTLDKVYAYQDLVSAMTGKRQGLEDSIEVCETVECVKALSWGE